MSDYIADFVSRQGNSLSDAKFAWRERKKDSLRLAKLCEASGQAERAAKIRSCASWSEFLVDSQLEHKSLYRTGFCKDRLCPLCTSRRAHVLSGRLVRVLSKVKESHDDVIFLFLTLTIQNVPASQLSAAIDSLNAGWKCIRENRVFRRSVKGTFRAAEITINPDTGEYHPHLHAILAVTPDYFTDPRLYLDHSQWMHLWRTSCGLSYDPWVHIESTYGGNECKKELRASLEAAKYACKSVDYLDWHLSALELMSRIQALTDALKGRRMYSLSGWLREAAKALNLDLVSDADLVHSDDGSDLNVEDAPFIARYCWTYGVADYLLECIKENPLFKRA